MHPGAAATVGKIYLAYFPRVRLVRAVDSARIEEFFRGYIGLAQNPRQGSHFDFMMHWNYATLYPAPHNYVAPALADFYKTQPLKRFY